MRVRNGTVGVYRPVGMDVWNPCSSAKVGQVVRVKNQWGCPPAGTMGHCHIVDAESGAFLGLVLCNSLTPNVRLIYWTAKLRSGLRVSGTYSDLKSLRGANKRTYRDHPDAYEWSAGFTPQDGEG